MEFSTLIAYRNIYLASIVPLKLNIREGIMIFIMGEVNHFPPRHLLGIVTGCFP